MIPQRKLQNRLKINISSHLMNTIKKYIGRCGGNLRISNLVDVYTHSP